MFMYTADYVSIFFLFLKNFILLSDMLQKTYKVPIGREPTISKLKVHKSWEHVLKELFFFFFFGGGGEQIL